MWGQEETWTEVSNTTQLNTIFANGGNAKLVAHLAQLYHFQVSKTVKLDLNGFSIIHSNDYYYSNGNILTVTSDGNLTILDSSDSKNGEISGGRNNNNAGGIDNQGTLIIQGGKITNNDGNSSGGGVYNSGTMTISGGSVSGNRHYGIYNKSGATLTITGGTIENNNSGGIYNDGTINISSAPKISGIYLPTGITINVDGTLSNSTPIGITMQTPGDFTNAYEGAYTHFVSDNTDYEVINTAENKASLRSCWAGLNVLLSQGGTISLSKDYKAVSTDGPLLVENGQTVTLDLNGHTLNRNLGSAVNDGCVIKNQGTLTINGTGGGVIKGGNSSSGGGGILNEGTLTINGGTIKENKTTSLGAGIYNVTGKTLTLNGGVIDNNQNTTNDGGGIYNQGTFTLTSGSIINNKVTGTSKNGGGIYNTGTMSINGGTIQNNTATGLGAGIYHDGTAFNLQGSPTISSNTVNNSARNVYLTTAHIITITGALSNTTAISLNMETLGVFTSGLKANGGTSANFSSEAGNSVKLTHYNASEDAELITYWNYLNRQLSDGNIPSITLEPGIYQATSSDSYLYIPSGRTVDLIINGQTLNRGLYNSTAIASGCVILNEGTLTINGTAGSITGGNNDDSNDIKGGGICNKGTLTLEVGTISGNKTSGLGGGIYNSGDLYIKGGTNNSNTSSGDADANGVYHNGSSLNIEGAPVVNIYLATAKTLTIPNPLTNSSADHIKIASADEHLIFTPGVDTSAYKDKFSSKQTSKGIGFNSNGYAMIGTKYTITRSNVTVQASAIRDEKVAVTVSASNGYIPITLNYTDEAQNVISLSSYPENSATYNFVMPAKNISVTATCYQGGYCGAGDEKKMKYYLQEGTLKFITDGTNCAMENYAASAVPWRGFTYSAIDLSSNVTSISNYAFAKVNNSGKFEANTSLATVNIPSNITSIGTKAFFNCTALAAIYVDPANPNYSAANGVLFNKVGTTLICYPAGKQENEANNYTYTMSNSVTSVAEGAFAFNTHLKGIAVTSGGSSFKGVDGVLYNAAETSLICYPAGKEGDSYTVASSVTSIGAYAFQSCSALRNLYVLRSMEETVTAGGTCMLDGTHSSLKILVKSGSVDAYKEAPNWSAYSGKIFAMDLSSSITITLNSSNPDDFDYEGVAITPDITVKDIVGTVLTEGVDYTVAYSNNNAVGTGHITVKGKGNYAGETTMDFYITRKVSFNSTKDYATYYSNEDLEIMSGGTAYVITGVNWTTGDITKVQVNYIKAQTPVILYKSGIGNAGNNPYYLKAHTGTSAYTGLYEYFMGKSLETSYNDLKTDGISDIYVLRGSSFARVSASGSLPANRCYLARPSSAAASRGINSLSLEGGGNDATSLSEVKDEEVNNNEWYTLDGRRLQGKPTKKGVYISKGKKIVVH